MDGHGSHHTAQFEEFCIANSIVTICMPPHSSHLLQPLDVGCFAPLKRSYGKQVESQIRLGINHITKEEFLSIYLHAHREAMSSNNIKSSFEATGLVPYEPDRVLSCLNPIIRTPSPVPSAESLWESKTPSNAAEIQRQATHIRTIRQKRRQNTISPSERPFEQLLKGFEVAVAERSILQAEIALLRAENHH